MNADQANNIDLPDLLSRMGFEPVSITKQGRELWYLSPLRTEKTPSFHISRGKKYAWVWKDFDSTKGGTVIDFIMRHQGHRNLKQALDYLKTIYSQSSAKILSMPKQVAPNQPTLFSFHGQEPKAQNFSEDKDLEFIKAHAVQNPIIFSYLMKERAIPRVLIERYLLEIHYHNKKLGKNFFAFGMKNRGGGYEIRAASDEYKFKSALITRDITFIKGSQPSRRSVNVFEGMTDFLSLLALYNLEQLGGDAMILHSVSSYARAADIIKGMDFRTIHTFLDNDDSGHKCTQRFIENFGVKVTAQNSIYESYQDLNKALVGNRPSQQLLS